MPRFSRFRERTDSEHEQAIIRVVILTLVLIYFSVYAFFEPIPSMWGIYTLGTHFLLSWILVLHIYWKPQVNPLRRLAGIISDMTSASIALYFLGESGALFFPLYLWVTIGNGLRFGQAYLATAVLLSLVGFSFVIVYGDFWQQHMTVALGIWLSLLALPVYFSVLLSRLNKSHEQLNTLLANAKEMADHDTLTGLLNRHSLFNKLEGIVEAADRTQKPFSVLFLDFDGFKQINDQHGHGFGDKLLKNVALRIQNSIRSDDVLARLGGDEFVAILLNIDREGTRKVGQKILLCIQEPFNINQEIISISASIGAACYPEDSMSGNLLVSQADMAMYEAKNLGKNRFCSYKTVKNSLKQHFKIDDRIISSNSSTR